MIQTKAVVPTINAERYMTQLCKHWSHKLTIEMSEEGARMVMLNGAITRLALREEGLEVSVEAETTQDLEDVKETVVSHLDRFAFREGPLAYPWSSVESV